MATEPNLRELFRGDTPALRSIDTATVIRRSKSRRLPAQIGIGGAFTLAIGGLGIGGLQGLLPQSASMTAESQDLGASDGGQQIAGGGDDGSAASSKRAPANRIYMCGGALAEIAPSETGLVLTTHFGDAPVGTAPVSGTVTLTNTGTETIVGYTTPTPAITLSQNGIVLWHSNGMVIQSIQDVSLAPGESLELAASFTPVVCGIDDEAAENFRTDLPPVPAGDYQVSAAADVTVDGANDVTLVTGPTQTVRIG